MARPKRKDKSRTVLRTGELQRRNEDMFMQKHLKHSGLKKKRLRRTKAMA